MRRAGRLRVLAAVTAALAVSVLVALLDARSDAAKGYDSTIRNAARSIESYWTKTFPEIYASEYIPLKGGLHGYTRQQAPPTCGGEKIPYAVNAFYCPYDDLIAWDDDILFPQEAARYGDLAVATILAHEWGHAVQFRARLRLPSILAELQADCFAGAWLKHAQTQAGDGIDVTVDAFDKALLQFLYIRDPSGASVYSPGAHGAGIDRVGALRHGYRFGAAPCATYPNDPPLLIELPFSDGFKQGKKSELVLDRIVALTEKSLRQFWEARDPSGTLPRLAVVSVAAQQPCAGERRTISDAEGPKVAYCPQDDRIEVREDALSRTHTRLGDFGTAMLIAQSWGRAELARNGRPTETREDRLAADCFAGEWIGALVVGEVQGPPMEAGDMDEALQALFVLGDDQDRREAGAILDRFEAFAAGILGSGTAPCGSPARAVEAAAFDRRSGLGAAIHPLSAVGPAPAGFDVAPAQADMADRLHRSASEDRAVSAVAVGVLKPRGPRRVLASWGRTTPDALVVVRSFDQRIEPKRVHEEYRRRARESTEQFTALVAGRRAMLFHRDNGLWELRQVRGHRMFTFTGYDRTLLVRHADAFLKAAPAL